jgi:uncharacterized membrane protein
LENPEVIGNRQLGKRIQIIDALRGASIILMVIYHFFVDLYLFGWFPYKVLYNNAVTFLQVFFACVFIVTSGVSCRFSKNNLKRGLLIFAAGMAITAATEIYSALTHSDLVVRFGILHFLGCAAILYALIGKPLEKLLPGFLMPVVCITLAVLTWNLQYHSFNVGFLWMFGITNRDFSSADYFPLMPFFFVYLFGAWLGKYIADGKFPRWFYRFKSPVLSYVGRKTLWIYLLHQPVFFAILYVFSFFKR